MSTLALAVLPALLLAVPDAQAAHPGYHKRGPRVRVSVALPGVNVRVGPWSVHYRAAQRPGYVWVDGYWQAGVWYPGHYVPVGGPPTPGYVWVNGYWDGEVYVDGFWRPPRKRGYVWMDGYYDGGVWIAGGWVRSAPQARPGRPAPVDEGPIYDDYGTPDDAPLALPQGYEERARTDGYREPATDDAPASGRVRSRQDAAEDYDPDYTDPAGVWGEPIEEEDLDEAPSGGVHHDLDW